MMDPIEQFHRWLDEARRWGVLEPTAMALATADAKGRPNVRMVFLQQADERGFVFYTHLDSPKAAELGENANVALCFYWNPPGRQVRIEGAVKPVSPKEADAHFDSRPYQNRITLWASKQSKVLPSPEELEDRVAKSMKKLPRGRIPRPASWSGFRVVPRSIEFLQDKPFQLHERQRYRRNAKGGWKADALYP